MRVEFEEQKFSGAGVWSYWRKLSGRMLGKLAGGLISSGLVSLFKFTLRIKGSR